MSKTIEHGGFLLVEVPEGFFGYSIIEAKSQSFVKISDRVGDYVTVMIPPGNYQIIGLAKDLSEDQWKDIVDGHYREGYYKVYSDLKILGKELDKIFEISGLKPEATSNPKASGHSLLKSHSLEPSTTLILKKSNE